MNTTLRHKYQSTVVPALLKSGGYRNMLAVPRITKVVINVGFGREVKDAKVREAVVATLREITGQQPLLRPARRSVSAFKLRKGTVIGASVTLRGARMWAFLDKLVNATLPRVRDFRGISAKGFDGHGNYTLGFAEATVFPEMAVHAETEKAHGVEVSVVTTAPTNQAGFALLSALGFPFKDMLAS